MRASHQIVFGAAFGLLFSFACAAIAQAKIASHPPLWPFPKQSARPLPNGPLHFVDPAKGKDDNQGTKGSPWKSVAHALTKLDAGDTLVLRGGVYYERIYCSTFGTLKKPITIRSFPGELGVIDGSFREFFADPKNAWEPWQKGAKGEYRSKRTYKNVRNVHGRFGDSMIGLQIYHYLKDLRGERYVGPGVWFNPQSGRIHARLQPYKADGVIRGRTEVSQKYLPSTNHQILET